MARVSFTTFVAVSITLAILSTEPVGSECPLLQDGTGYDFVYDQVTANNAEHLVVMTCYEGYEPGTEIYARCDSITNVFQTGPSGMYCTAIKCDTPNSLANGTVVTHSTNYGGTYNATCDAGYELIGSSERACVGEGVWNGTEPYCKEIDECSGVTCVHGTCLDLIDNFTCICDAGFLGSDCSKRVSCPAPQEVTNGTLSLPPVSFYEAVYNITCDAGLELVGSTSRTCQSDGTWSGCEPVCLDLRSNCTDTTCDHGVCHDLGDDFICFCDAGYTGTLCDTGVSCPAPKEVDNGTLSLPANTLYEAVYNTTCSTGYELVGSASRACQIDGTWSGCEPVCLDLRSNCTDTTCDHGVCHDLGDDFICFCDAGYTGTLCDTGVSCPAPKEVDNGTLSLPANTLYEAVYNITCRTGYELVGSASRTCQIDGTWSGCEPVCLDVNNCTETTCKHGICHDLIDDFVCFCEDGYTGRLCDTAISCGSPEDVENGTRHLPNTLMYGAVYNITCSPGYNLVGSDSRRCQLDGTWSGASPVCLSSSSVTTLDDCENVTCLHGVCQDLLNNFKCFCENGFTGTYCDQVVSCPTPVVVDQASLNVSAGLTYGSIYTITCDSGYRLFGSSSRTCQNDGTWSGDNPVCLNVDDCENANCYHGRCRDLINSFECVCEDGYSGSSCDTDVNECLSDKGGCEQLCFNLEGTHFCYCEEGYLVDDQDPSKCKGNFGVHLKVVYDADFDEDLANTTSVTFGITKADFEKVFVGISVENLLKALQVALDGMNIQFKRGSVVADMGFVFKTPLTLSQRSIIAAYLADLAKQTPVNISGNLVKASSAPVILPRFPESGNQLEVTSVCSLYDESDVCGEDGKCEDQNGKPMCICSDGSTGLDCNQLDRSVKNSIADRADIVYVVVIVILLVIIVFLVAMICALRCRKTTVTDTSSSRQKFMYPSHVDYENRQVVTNYSRSRFNYRH